MKILHDLSVIHCVQHCPVCGKDLLQFKILGTKEQAISAEYAEAILAAGIKKYDFPCCIACTEKYWPDCKTFDPEEQNLLELGIATGNKKRIDMALKMVKERKD